MTEKNKNQEYKGGKLSEAVVAALGPFFEKLSANGIKKTVNDFAPGINLDKFVLEKIKSQLSKHRVIELDNIYLDKVEIQYRSDGIQIEPSGALRFLIRKITITDEQILNSFESILHQIEEKYIKNNEYIINKIDEIIVSLSSTGIYKPKNSKEKTLYDFAMKILLNYYKLSSKKTPKWMNTAIENIGKGEFLSSWIEILIDYISEVIADVSENIFVNFKVTFDSLMIRIVLDKKTNKGQISSLMKMLNIDVKKIIYSFAKSYISPSFTKGIGEILADIASSLLSTVDSENKSKISSKPFNITIAPGEDFETQRSFTWQTNEAENESFIEYSYEKDLTQSTKVKSESITVPKAFPFINLGLIAGYKTQNLKKHSAVLKNLKPGKVYYKITTQSGEETPIYSFEVKEKTNSSKIMIFADSQGMTKQDYEVFSAVMDTAFENNKTDFMVHLGDFVDDGNNEEYWNWLLSSVHWKENVCIPLAGNHEARKSAVAIKAGVENAIIGHFSVKNLPPQDTSKGIYYSFEHSGATFVVLNTNFSDSGLGEAQYSFALETLKNSKSKWKIIFTHKSPYSNGPHCKDSDVKKIANQIDELAYLGGADAIFGGHDHVYVRTKILSCKKIVGSEEYSKKGTVYTNPLGSVFVVPGTSGVKNYAQKMDVKLPAEKILSPEGPVYSVLSINENELKFEAFLANEEGSKLIDSFAIKKESKNQNSKYVSKLISSLPDMPWLDDSDKLKKIKAIYENLSYHEKITVKNSGELFKAIKLRKNYSQITAGRICRVTTRKEFLSAFKNPKVGTIIAEGEEIKFGKNFIKNTHLNVTRPLCIRGTAKLTQINFTVEKGMMLTLADNICIDNTRKFGNFCSDNIIDLLDDCALIVSDFASINSFFGGSHKEKGIKITGENCRVYLGSSSTNFVKNGFLEAPNLDSKIFVTAGKYLSLSETFNVNCKLEVSAGFVRSIKGLENSEINIFGGIIGEKNNVKYPAPIKSSGKITVISGKIRDKDGTSIMVTEAGNCKVKKSNLESYIDISGKILYN